MLRSSVTTLALLLIADCNAFVVPSTSTFVHRTDTIFLLYDKARAFAPTSARALSKDGEMSMNLLDRFVRVAKGNINSVLNNLESPEKIMDQAVKDMQVRSTSRNAS